MDRRSFQVHLDHLVAMWKKAAFREHAVQRAKEMAKECPDLYGRMPKALEEITDQLRIEASARRAASSSQSPESSSAKDGQSSATHSPEPERP